MAAHSIFRAQNVLLWPVHIQAQRRALLKLRYQLHFVECRAKILTVPQRRELVTGLLDKAVNN